ncbi:histone deacetylase [Saprospiraceae bacterium]|jgi:acetoin utilization deacetylase AcuC-like enzyme|nr:histone deacetylase [Saprospiraceae bacterium]MDF1865756.1 histone deacetylase [Saprospiraceae bacterium]
MLKIAWSPIYKYELPENHRFPMIKYELLPEQLIYEGTVSEQNFFHPKPVSEEIILQTHEKTFWDKLKNLTLSRKEIRAIGFPLSENLVRRGTHIANGTLQAALFAQEFGIAMNIAGGTHHSFTNRGEGFCLLNDIGIASNYLINNNLSNKVLVIDLDVHQGNGTAQIFRNNPKVFTFSMHGAKNYPIRKEKSDLDIGLPDKTEDDFYLKILRNTIPALMENVQPDFIFYLSGVDVLKSDKLGRLHMTLEGCKERDRIVLEACHKNEIPVGVSMGGGYSEKISTIIEAHANTFRLAQEVFF